MGITLLTKEIKPKNIFYRNEVQYRDYVPTKRKGCEVTKLKYYSTMFSIPATWRHYSGEQKFCVAAVKQMENI